MAPTESETTDTMVFAKSNFRNGGANLRVCLDSPQGIATISEITFGKQSILEFRLEFVTAGFNRKHRPAIFESQKLHPRALPRGFSILPHRLD